MSALGLDDGNSSHYVMSTRVLEMVGIAVNFVVFRLGEL
jgi:hypothetical protein